MVFILLIIILTVFSIDLLINESHRQAIVNISKYEPFQDLGSGLLITFWVCLIGNLLPVPTPYTFVVCFSSLPFLTLNLFIPLLIGFIASLGCLIGEMGGYVVGRGAAELISDEKIKSLKKWQLYLVEHPKFAPFLVFIAALTPINDDLITIPLGLIKYSPKKTIFWCWLGKFGLMLIFAYNTVGICGLLGGEDPVLSIVALYGIVIFVYLMIRIDMSNLLKKIILRKRTN